MDSLHIIIAHTYVITSIQLQYIPHNAIEEGVDGEARDCAVDLGDFFHLVHCQNK